MLGTVLGTGDQVVNMVNPFRSNLVGTIPMECGKCYNKDKHQEQG